MYNRLGRITLAEPIVLVLSRRAGESIVIGGEVEVIILGNEGGQVRVGIRAPREITVLRKELLQEVEDEKRLAAAGTVPDRLSALVEKTEIQPKH
jgi:carbon storage regulator